MTNLREIEKAVEHLPGEKLSEFRRWFDDFDAALWDKQFEQDVQGGRLDKLADGAIKDLRAGRCTEL